MSVIRSQKGCHKCFPGGRRAFGRHAAGHERFCYYARLCSTHVTFMVRSQITSASCFHSRVSLQTHGFAGDMVYHPSVTPDRNRFLLHFVLLDPCRLDRFNITHADGCRDNPRHPSVCLILKRSGNIILKQVLGGLTRQRCVEGCLPRCQ
jgi:hypothetical protein